MSRARKEKRWSRRLAKSRIYDSPPLMYYVVPNSIFLGVKRFVPSISISFKCEFFIVMQIQHTKNLTPRDLNWVQH